MENYIIRVKKLKRSTFSTIMVWLEDPSERHSTSGSVKDEQLTLGWLANHEEIRKKLNISSRDTEKITIRLICNFQDDFSDIIMNLHQVTSMEQVMAMTGFVALFISECVLSNNQQLELT